MGAVCSCLAGLDHQHHDHHAVRYGDVPKYAAPCERLQQVHGSSILPGGALEQKNSGLHSSSPRKGREAPSLAIDQSDLQQPDEQGAQQQPGQQHWHSPTAAERQHPQYLQTGAAGGGAAGAAAAAGVDAAAQQEHEEIEVPDVPFSWTKGELIGIGAFGRVYTALNNETGELVAVKQVSFAKDEALQGRVAEHIRALEAEVDVLKNLKHENIVRYLGTERTSDALHIFLEYVPGGSIASLLTRFGAFPEPVIRVYTAQLLRGLEYLHARGIMHRDIKGANILIDKHGTVKLADFGASKKIEDLATVGSGSKSIRGTPYWMAPEVIKQTGHGRPADIWSLACTVIEMATGKPPWSTYTAPVAAMFQIASSKDPPPLPDHLSPEAKDFLLLCFNRVARDRANATRLLKHPFVVKAQLPQPAPFPGSSPSNAANNSNGSPAGQRTPAAQGRSMHASSAAAAGAAAGVTPPPASRTGEQRQPHTPPGARHSTGMQPAFASSNNINNNNNASSSLRPSAMSAAAIAANSKARCSPPSHAHGSPRRQQQQQHPGVEGQAASSASPGSAGAGLAQRGDASAVVTAMRPQQQTAAKQQQDGPLVKQQQHLQQQQQQSAQQDRQSPRAFETQGRAAEQQQQQQQQQQQPLQQPSQQQQQQQGRRSITPRSAAAEAGTSGQDACMTLVDWNPMVEPSWMPGSYQVPPAAARRDKAGSHDQQQQQYGPGRTAGSSNGSRDHQRPSAGQQGLTAADAAGDMQQQQQHTPGRYQGQQPGSMAVGSAAAATAATAGHLKRGGGGGPGAASSSILSAGPGGSTRSNGGIGSRMLEGSAGPLASGPVGRASRENGFGFSAAAAAGAGTLPPGTSSAAAGAGAAASVAGGGGGGGAGAGAAGRLGSSRAWGQGISAAAAAPAPGSGQPGGAGGTPMAGSGSSPARSASAASGTSCDADGGYDSIAAAARAHSSGAGSGMPLSQQPEVGGHRLSSSGSYGRSSSLQPGGDPVVAEAAMAQLSSKHAQWEQELLEELARQREEHRASRVAGQGASRRSALQP